MFTDIALGIVLCWGAYRGYRQGFARQMIPLTALLIGLLFGEVAAARLLPIASKWLPGDTDVRLSILFLLSVFLIYVIVTMPTVSMLAAYRKKVFGENTPSIGDRVFGIGLGLVKGSVIVSLAVFGFNRLPVDVHRMALVQKEYGSSHAVAAANQAKLIDRILKTKEGERVVHHLSRIVQYYAKPPATTG